MVDKNGIEIKLGGEVKFTGRVLEIYKQHGNKLTLEITGPDGEKVIFPAPADAVEVRAE